MSSFSTGRSAEQLAVSYLKKNKFQIMEQNWRTRYCEIDIIAKKAETVYFIEVKYRKNNNYGSGLEYINQQKLSQMQFAAELWVSMYDWRGDYQLSAVAVDQTGVTDFIESVDL